MGSNTVDYIYTELALKCLMFQLLNCNHGDILQRLLSWLFNNHEPGYTNPSNCWISALFEAQEVSIRHMVD